MIRSTLALSLLVLAAASQAVVLAPASTRGWQSSKTGASYTDDLVTVLLGSSRHPDINVFRGWRTEFDLSDLPDASRLLSATLTTTVAQQSRASFLPQTIVVRAYTGTGTVPLASPGGTALPSFECAPQAATVRLDVASALRSAKGRYLGLDFSTSTNSLIAGTPTNNGLVWTTPTLTLAYAPVPEPAPLAALGLGALAVLRRRKA